MARQRANLAQLELRPQPDPLADGIAAVLAAPVPDPPPGSPTEQKRWAEGRAAGVDWTTAALGYARKHRMTLAEAIEGLSRMPTPRPPRDGFCEQQQWCAGHLQAVRDCRRILFGVLDEIERRK